MEKKAEASVKITELKIKLGQKEITLTTEEAHKLKDALDDLFGKEVIREIVHDHWHDWWYTKPSPYWQNPGYYTVCGGGAGMSSGGGNYTAWNGNGGDCSLLLSIEG